ncbi:MAG: 6-phosphogluconolactonase [Clostridia bacterium]|nr:6-phosphogluconolactonase [Clostridia bacterium]
MKSYTVEKLQVQAFPNRDEMGKASAKDVAACIKKLLAEKDEINMIFAAAPSQNDMLYYLVREEDIEWNKINAFHMDEYIGLNADAPQCFSNFLKQYIFDLVPFKSVNLINPAAESAEEECARYTKLLLDNPVDIVCMGIGENGHIAFNDPHVADFNDPKTVKVVSLDEMCRTQQVHDGCFETLDQVPKYAMTLTIPTLMKATYKFCVVPAPTKANAVKETVLGEISERCPATAMRVNDNSIMYLDADSSALIQDLLK